MSETMERRLNKVYKALSSGCPTLTSDELIWLQRAMLDGALMHRKSSEAGASPPHPQDGTSVDDERACLQPKWIGLVCRHMNGLWKQIRCRNCAGCHHSWRATVRAKILAGCEGHKVWMWTLTLAEYPKDMKEDRFDFIQERWHYLLRNGGKRGIAFEYLRVVELQKRGTPHFHLAVKQFTMRGQEMSHTKAIANILRDLAQGAGFGYIMDFQAARLGGAGVAAYMAKYMTKETDWYELRREDGRAIRRYARSRGWIPPQPRPTWRYARDGGRFSHTQQNTQDVPCNCSEGFVLHRHQQARRWLDANQRAGYWIAPTGVGDYLLQQEKDE